MFLQGSAGNSINHLSITESFDVGTEPPGNNYFAAIISPLACEARWLVMSGLFYEAKLAAISNRRKK
jgi:hypothetical protein